MSFKSGVKDRGSDNNKARYVRPKVDVLENSDNSHNRQQ